MGRAAALAILSFLAYWSTLQVPVSSDATAHVYTAFSFVREGDADLDEYARARPPFEARAFVAADGHVYSPYLSGLALIFAPIAALATVAGIDPASSAGAGVLAKLLASLLVSASVALVYVTLAREVKAETAGYLTLAYALATPVFGVASQSLSEHAASAFLIALAIVLVLARDADADPRSIAGLPLGLAAIVRPTNALALLAVVTFLGRRGPGPAMRALLWAAGPLSFQLLVNIVTFGSPLGPPRPLPLGSILEGMAGQLVSPSRGLLVYCPWLLAGLVGLAAAWLGTPDRLRWLLRSGSLAFLATLVVFGSYAEWWGGWTFGNRYLADLLPFYMLGMVEVVRRGWLRSIVARAAFAVAIGWSLLLQAVGAGLYYFTWNGSHWDVTPNIDVTPERLWSWTDTQWQFLLRRLVTDPGPAMIVEVAVMLVVVVAGVVIVRRSSVVTAPVRPARSGP